MKACIINVMHFQIKLIKNLRNNLSISGDFNFLRVVVHAADLQPDLHVPPMGAGLWLDPCPGAHERHSGPLCLGPVPQAGNSATGLIIYTILDPTFIRVERSFFLRYAVFDKNLSTQFFLSGKNLLSGVKNGLLNLSLYKL